MGKSTIYRRCRTKRELLLTAVGSLAQEAPDPPDTPDLRAALVHCIHGLQRLLDDAAQIRLIAHLCGVAATDAELYATCFDRTLRPHRDTVRTVLEKAMAQGCISRSVDVDLTVDLLVGPMLLRALGASGQAAAPNAVSGPDPGTLVDSVLNGLSRR
ncbi:TetR-like C-terminal domain-containing protein [Streptomyces lasalocidi]